MAAKKTETLCVGCDKSWQPKEWEGYTGVCDTCLSSGKSYKFFKRQINSIKISKVKPEKPSVQPQVVSSPIVEPEKKTPSRDPLYHYINVEKID